MPEDMKILTVVLLTILLAIVACLAYAFDQWLGIVAFTYRYLFFCALVGLLYWAMWFMVFKKYATLVGLGVFAILAANFLLPAPSERILRSALLRIQLGADSDAIERIVKEEYDGSGYVLPRITKEGASVHVSLLSQQAGNCTAILFNTEGGVVVRRYFSAD